MTTRAVRFVRQWNGSGRPRQSHGSELAHGALSVPPPSLEYGYYVAVAYSFTAAYFGLEIPLAAAAMTIALAAACCRHLGANVMVVFAPIGLLVGCVLSFMVIQVLFHQSPRVDEINRTCILWIAGMLINQTLCLREGFVRRCTIVVCAIGLFAVPDLTFNTSGSVARATAGAELGGNLRNANGLGGWFGFCFVAFAMLGLATRRHVHRLFYWLAALGCLLVTTLTVSRGAVLASALALAVGFRQQLRRSFAPLVLMVLVGGIAFELGVFDQAVTLFETRGMEDTGRLVLWPHVIDRIMEAPLVGVGYSEISTYIPEVRDWITTPHNSYLFFALASGIVPFTLWTVFWLRTGWRSLTSPSRLDRESLRLPFFVYVFVGLMFGDIGIDPWFLLTCAVAAGPPITVRRAALAGGYVRPRRRPVPLGNGSYSTVSRAVPPRRPLASNLRD